MLSWILLMMLSHENRRRIGQYPWQIGDKHVHTWLCELETPLDGHAQEVLECEKVAKILSKAVLRAVCIFFRSRRARSLSSGIWLFEACQGYRDKAVLSKFISVCHMFWDLIWGASSFYKSKTKIVKRGEKSAIWPNWFCQQSII